MIDKYLKHESERRILGIPPLPLDQEQTISVCELLKDPPSGSEDMLINLLKERVPPGVDPAAKVKAGFLADIIDGVVRSPLIDVAEAIRILGAMLGGYNVKPLLEALCKPETSDMAVASLSRIILVHDTFEEVNRLSETVPAARKVLESWANAEWFTARPALPETLRVRVFRVDGEVNTDDFSPAGDAWSRPDIPLHSLSMGKVRFPGGIDTIADYRAKGEQVAFVADVIGTGSSRKSACNSLLWHIGEDIPHVPNKRRGGVILGGTIAPIFFNTAQDSGALPIRCDVTLIKNGEVIIINTVSGEIIAEYGDRLTTFSLLPATLPDEYRAGGRIPIIIGRSLTAKARSALGMEKERVFVKVTNPTPALDQKYTLAQKMLGTACGVPGVLPGSACEPRMTTVGSQDTTGPMTADELKELACLRFQAPLFMQSFCHTAAYPKSSDISMHSGLPDFVADRGGVTLKPGDGVIHNWLNRLILPDTVGTGGDSHTRFPIGISFPAGSGLVAFAGALGFMPLDMPESVLVRFTGKLNPGITVRDLVNAVPYEAIRQGLLTVPKKNKKNVFSGRIIEMEGLPDLPVEEAFELTNAAAERSAAAACIKLSTGSVATHLRSNIALMRRMIADGYRDSDALTKRIEAMEAWLENPRLLEADEGAEYAETLEIDLSTITEPILACPNDPDDVRLLSEVAGARIDDVFIGSCMTSIGHFRAASEIWRGAKFNPDVRIWVCPPTRMDHDQLKKEGRFSVFGAVGAHVEIPGCSLCMGNQARVPDNVTVFSTSTRNFDNRMGNGARVFLGSAELAAVAGILGRIPFVEEYLTFYRERIEPMKDKVYRPIHFQDMEEYS